MTDRSDREKQQARKQAYWKYAGSGIQFASFVLVGTLGGSYLDKYFGGSGSGLIALGGVLFGLTGGFYFIFKDMLFPGRRKRE